MLVSPHRLINSLKSDRRSIQFHEALCPSSGIFLELCPNRYDTVSHALHISQPESSKEKSIVIYPALLTAAVTDPWLHFSNPPEILAIRRDGDILPNLVRLLISEGQKGRL
ncbi:hypothetical protein J437_LFUL011378 [Ladona fulva]|uniref:Uncharacterized protein n=1 Tax=Ladona fulva TaxID=123851 RepID=A0A8K0KB49_LADFU|nr:hypothetical protein J437_LFUL011378 [Ladona fulva]